MGGKLEFKMILLNNMKSSKEKVFFSEDVVKLALEEGHNSYAFWGLYQVCYNSILFDDGYRGVLTLPKFLDIADNHFQEIEDSGNFDKDDLLMLIVYIEDIILCTCEDYYQVDDEKYYQILEDLKERTKRYGLSLKRYYELKVNRGIIERKKEEVKKIYPIYKGEKRAIYPNFEPSEMAMDIIYKLLFHEISHIKPILEELFRVQEDVCDRFKCNAVEEILKYSLINRVDIEKEMEINIEDYIKKSFKLTLESRNILVSILIMYYSNKNIHKAITLFCENIQSALKTKNYYYKLNFYGASTILFEALKYNHKTQTIKLLLLEELEFYEEKGVYEVDKLIKEFSQRYMDLLEKFKGKTSKNDTDYIEEVRRNILGEKGEGKL